MDVVGFFSPSEVIACSDGDSQISLQAILATVFPMFQTASFANEIKVVSGG
jgi:hypothetical protein